MIKKLFTLTTFAILGLSTSFGMSRERASEEADFLTDKMAYELGLTEAQWADVYEINYDYFRVLDRLGRSYTREHQLRDAKLKYVLTVSQWERYCSINYFMIPVKPGLSDWIFTIYNHYKRQTFYYNSRHIVDVYRGKHRKHATFYQNRYQPRYRQIAPIEHHGQKVSNREYNNNLRKTQPNNNSGNYHSNKSSNKNGGTRR